MNIEAKQLEAMAEIIAATSKEVSALQSEIESLKQSSNHYYQWWQDAVSEVKALKEAAQ